MKQYSVAVKFQCDHVVFCDLSSLDNMLTLASTTQPLCYILQFV